MQVIPSINETEFEEVKNKLRRAEEFLPTDGWAHLDITDGAFSSHRTWNNFEELTEVRTSLNLEVHLMVENPEGVLRGWLEALARATLGKKRVVVHFEAMSDPAFVLSECAKYGAEAGLALNINTSPELVSIYAHSFALIQILAVAPGPGGQKFDQRAIDKIRFFRQKGEDVIIEVDGGMNFETAVLVKNAGANIIVAGSYIWSNPSPKAAYDKLATSD